MCELPLNQILPGDCIEVLKTLSDKSVDLVFADPPYNLQLQQELRRPNETLVDGVDDDWDQFDSFTTYDTFTRAWLSECRRVLKDTGTIWVIGSYHNIFRVGSIMMDLGYWILNDVIWHKTNPMPNFRGTRFTNATETLIWAKKSQTQKRYTFNHHTMKHLNDDKQMTSVWEIPLCVGKERIKIDGRKAHSTQKPEALLYRVLMASSNPGDVVLDPFFGSGTTGAVALKLDRHFIGVEREPAYVSLARERLAAIPTSTLSEDLLVTPDRRQLPRVPFGKLIEAEYVQIGQPLYSSKRQYAAIIKADAHIASGDMSGSIHRVAAQLTGKNSVNGWDFWHVETKAGELVPIDHLRQRYRAEILR